MSDVRGQIMTGARLLRRPLEDADPGALDGRPG